MSHLISVIIPTFNRGHTLPAAIRSVISQSADNWELVILDDGSTDNTKDVIDVFLTHEKVTYFFQKNTGVAVARNKGVELCRGDYLLFLDSDDTLASHAISRLNEVNFTRYDLVCWQALKKIDGKISVWKPEKLEKIYNNIKATFLAGSICYKKGIFIQAGGFDPEMKFGENYELGMRISDISNIRIKIINEPLLNYNVPENRESNSLENRLSSYFHLYQKHQHKFAQDKVSDSKMNYLLGFVHEKSGNFKEARRYYKKSFRRSHRNFKAFLKLVFFKILRR